MSGIVLSRLFMAVGWMLLVIGIAVYTAPLAAVVGGALLILYGVVGVDVTTPSAKQRKQAERELAQRRNGNTYVTTPRR